MDTATPLHFVQHDGLVGFAFVEVMTGWLASLSPPLSYASRRIFFVTFRFAYGYCNFGFAFVQHDRLSASPLFK